jgi:hypothetical protein
MTLDQTINGQEKPVQDKGAYYLIKVESPVRRNGYQIEYAIKKLAKIPKEILLDLNRVHMMRWDDARVLLDLNNIAMDASMPLSLVNPKPNVKCYLENNSDIHGIISVFQDEQHYNRARNPEYQDA